MQSIPDSLCVLFSPLEVPILSVSVSAFSLKMKISYVALCIMLTLFLAQTELSMAVTCNALQLSACASAIISSSPPTAVCCSKLKEQKPCLCQYLKDPNLKKFVNSPNARKVADTCGSPFPTC